MSAASAPASNAAQAYQAARIRIQELEDQVANLRARGQEIKVKAPEPFEGKRDDLRRFIAQFNVYANSQSNRIADDKDKVLLASSFLKGTAANWFEPYLRQHFEKENEDQDDEVKAAFRNYEEFVRQLSAMFGAVDEALEAEQRLQRLRQTKSAMAYFTEARQIISHLDWDEDAYMAVLRLGLKEELKDELARFDDKPETLAKFIERVVRIDNRMWERKQEKARSNRQGYWKPKQGTQKRRKDPYGPEPMDLDTTEISKEEQRKKNLCFYCSKPGHRANECRKRAGDRKRKAGKERSIDVRVTELEESQVTELEETCDKDWCTRRDCLQHFRSRNLARERLWRSEDAGWTPPISSWDTSDPRHCAHDSMHWTACYEDDCSTHQQGKETGCTPKTPPSYRKKKNEEWVKWNKEKRKPIKTNTRARALAEETSEITAKTAKTLEAPLKWWERPLTYNPDKPAKIVEDTTKAIRDLTEALQELETRDSDKKPTKKETPPEVPKVLAKEPNKDETEQKTSETESESALISDFALDTEEDDEWYGPIIAGHDQDRNRLWTCEWSHWITCHNDECDEHRRSKERNSHYPKEPWVWDVGSGGRVSDEPIYGKPKEKRTWVRNDATHRQHNQVEWKECTDDQCTTHRKEKIEAAWYPSEPGHHVEEGRYHWHKNDTIANQADICYNPRCSRTRIYGTQLAVYTTMARGARQGFAPGAKGFEGFKILMRQGLIDTLEYLVEQQSKNW